MSALKNLANKLATPADEHHHHHHDGLATTSSSTLVGTTGSTVVTDSVVTTGTTVQTGEILAQKQVGTVDVVETVQQVKKVPVVETTRAVETLNTGMAAVAIDSTRAVKTELPLTMDHKTVVVDALVEETVRKDRLVQVQPVIHQEVEKEEIHHIVKHINEAPAPSVAGTVTLKPVVQEHVHTHVIEEIHPVIHREIVVQEVERVEEHITEHIVAPTKHVQEVIYEKEVAPVHVHGAACHHAVATERLTNVILPTAAVGTATAATVTTREVLVDKAGPAVVTGATREVVTDVHTANRAHCDVIVDKKLDGRAVVVDKHTEVVGGTTVVGGAHSARVVETSEVLVEDGKEKHHHHLHLPHFLTGHKKEETTHTHVAKEAL